MKKIITVIAALAIAVSASAQFGIIGGLTSSSNNLKTAWNDVTSQTINQYHVGVAFKFPIALGFAVQPSLMYNVKGAEMKNVGNIADINFKTGFLELNAQVQWGIDLKVIRPYVFAEPFVGYAITNVQNEVNKITQNTVSENSWDNVKNRLEYGVGAGVGIDFLERFQVSVRYFWNLGNLYDFSWGALSGVTETQCNGIAATVGFFF